MNNIFYLLFILFTLYSNLYAQKSELFSQEFTKKTIQNSDIIGWESTAGTDIITQCGKEQILGGFEKLGQHSLEKSYENLPDHIQIQIKFSLYKLDNWNPSDNLKLYNGAELLQTITKLSNPLLNNENICGDPTFTDQIQQIDLTFTHTQDTFNLSFQGTFDQPPSTNSWGIRDLKIYLIVCNNNQQQIGNKCYSKKLLTECSNSLQDVHKNIQPQATLEKQNEQFYYQFTLTYLLPYTHNPDCFDQHIKVQNTQLHQGNAQFDQWNLTENVISFAIQHKDLEDKYNCQKQETSNEEFIWTCKIALHILLGDEVLQHTFSFDMKSTLDKEQKNTINLSLDDSENWGEGCCENKLNIDTNLKFCKTIQCTEFYELPFTAKRSEELFIQHQIDSPDFQAYYLHPQDVIIFGVKAEILELDGSQPGKLIYKVKSQLAFDDMLVEVISIVENEAFISRRFLQNESILGENYDIKAISQISILSENDYRLNQLNTDNNNQKEGDQSNDDHVHVEAQEQIQMLTIALICVSLVVVVSILVGVCYCLRKSCQGKKNKKKYMDKEKLPQTVITTINTEI